MNPLLAYLAVLCVFFSLCEIKYVLAESNTIRLASNVSPASKFPFTVCSWCPDSEKHLTPEQLCLLIVLGYWLSAAKCAHTALTETVLEVKTWGTDVCLEKNLHDVYDSGSNLQIFTFIKEIRKNKWMSGKDIVLNLILQIPQGI